MKNSVQVFMLSIIGVMFTFVSTFAQNPIPNAGFESWNGPEIVSWAHNSTSFIPTVVQTTDAFSGSFAVRGEVINAAGAGFPPTLFTGSFQDPRFIVIHAYQTFTGQYKYSGQGGDMLFIEVVFTNDNIGGGAEGHAQIGADATSFTEIEIPMVYDSGNPPGWVPTHGNITVTIQPATGQVPHIGTYFIVDHFSFDGQPVSVELEKNDLVPDQFALKQNFPNPFNPATKISFNIAKESFATLKVYNMQGEEVATLVNENLSVGNYTANWNAKNYASGTYIYTLIAEGVFLSNKMILMK